MIFRNSLATTAERIFSASVLTIAMLLQPACTSGDSEDEVEEVAKTGTATSASTFGFTKYGQKKMMSCMVELAKNAYFGKDGGINNVDQQTGGVACNNNYFTQTYSTPWSLIKTRLGQSVSNDTVNTWQRTVTRNGFTERQVAFAWRGTATTGDWYQNFQAEVGYPRKVSLANNNISTVKSPFNSSRKVAKPWHTRVKNNSILVDRMLDYVEAWQVFSSNSSSRRLRIFHIGHSRAGAESTLAGLYTAMRYRDQPRRFVEVYAFNPARLGDKNMATLYTGYLNTEEYSTKGLMLHQYTITGDPVHRVPIESSWHHPLWNTSGTKTISNPYNRTFDNCPHYHAPQQSNNPINNHIPVGDLWDGIIEDLYDNNYSQFGCMTRWDT